MPASLKRTQTVARLHQGIVFNAIVSFGSRREGPDRHMPSSGERMFTIRSKVGAGASVVLSANSSRRRSKCMRRHQHCGS